MGVEPPHRVGAEGPHGVCGAVEPQGLRVVLRMPRGVLRISYWVLVHRRHWA